VRFDAGTTDVPTAGTRVQVSNTKNRVLIIEFHARDGNTGNIYVGISDVSATNGRELSPGEAVAINFTGATSQSDGSVLFEVFFVDAATNGDDVDWTVILA
jgi:hypothetical protein